MLATSNPFSANSARVRSRSRHGRERSTPGGNAGEAAFHLLLLAENLQGYKNLVKLSSIAYREGFYYKPRIDKEILRQFNKGLIATSACLGGEGCTNAGVKIGALCNPGDRVCGPEPRKAPANKIAFSGVGDFTPDTGKKASRSVLFRIDLEDHSEPGGSHPGGATPPADRYRIRIWILSAAELARLQTPGDQLFPFRMAIAASPASTPVRDGAVDGSGHPISAALGTAVFGVRAPDIDDGGELNDGNVQIHPQIKDCP